MKKLGAFIIGAALGGAAAFALSPKSGSENCAFVKTKLVEVSGDLCPAQVVSVLRQVCQSACDYGKDVVFKVQGKGQEVGAKVADVAGDAAEAVAPKAADNDELRQKIEAARQRIAAQVAQNAQANAAAAEEPIPVEAEAAVVEEPAPAQESAPAQAPAEA